MDLKYIDVRLPDSSAHWYYSALNVSIDGGYENLARLKLDTIQTMLKYFIFDVAEGRLPKLVNPRLRPEYGGAIPQPPTPTELLPFVAKFRSEILKTARSARYRDMTAQLSMRMAIEQVARNHRLELDGLNEVSPDELVQIVKRRTIKEH